MDNLHITSSITFLYFNDLAVAKAFFSDTLGLPVVYDPGWSCVYRINGKAFIGAVDNAAGSIRVESRDGLLGSITVDNIEAAHKRIKDCGVDVSSIKMVKDIDLKSFFFTGPEGYKFEIQQFTCGELSQLF